jgi:hypothetical protein
VARDSVGGMPTLSVQRRQIASTDGCDLAPRSLSSGDKKRRRNGSAMLQANEAAITTWLIGAGGMAIALRKCYISFARSEKKPVAPPGIFCPEICSIRA